MCIQSSVLTRNRGNFDATELCFQSVGHACIYYLYIERVTKDWVGNMVKNKFLVYCIAKELLKYFVYLCN